MDPLNRDPHLWQRAKARVKFQFQLVAYLVVNAGLWVIWALTSRGNDGLVPWPVWVSAFWGLGLVLSGLAAYGSLGFGRAQRTQREYERLLREQGGSNSGH